MISWVRSCMVDIGETAASRYTEVNFITKFLLAQQNGVHYKEVSTISVHYKEIFLRDYAHDPNRSYQQCRPQQSISVIERLHCL